MSDTEKAIYRLVLHPEEANYAPESTAMIQTLLHDIGFIGDACELEGDETAPQGFLVGEQFLQLLTFMGCSPNINLAPQQQGDRDYCHIVLSPIYTQPHFRRHDGDVFARCPECGRRDPDWQTQIERWQADMARTDYTCPHCENTISLYDLRWRQAAGFGRFFIDVFSIFPQEGIPTDKLLMALKKASGQPWTYFFTNR